MAAGATATPSVPTTDENIEFALAEAGKVAEIFSPAVAEAIKQGAAMEPVVSGLFSMFARTVRHHTKKQ